MLVITTMYNTRDKIIQSALKLFSKKGFLGTTTKEIAQEARIAEVTLFRYFKSKENLFVEVLRSQSFLPTLKDIIPKIKKMEYKRALETVAKYFIALLKQKKDLICIMHAEMFQYPSEIREINSKIIQEIHLVFASYLEDLKTDNILKKDLDTTYAASSFFGMLFNLFIKKEFLKRKINFKRALKTYIDIFYDGTRRIK